MRQWLLAAGVMILSAGCSESNEGQFPRENISIIIPYGPGGGFDTTVRVFAPYFAAQLGDQVNVLPQNMPGTGGRRGTASVFRADPDGYTLGILNMPGLVLPSILGETVDYDLRQMSWIGRIESQDFVLLVQADSDIHSIEDLQAQDRITFVSIGYGATVLAAIQIIAEQLGLMNRDPIFLTGYEGTTDQLVALVRGDGNATLSPVSTALQYIESGNLRPIAVTGENRSSVLADVPTFVELGYPDLSQLNVQRLLAGPPGLDSAIMALLRDAFLRAIDDPEFKSAAATAQMDVAPLDGELAAVEVDANFNFYEKFKSNLANPN
ncbi:MAG: tripartite tricarboxylate transporter substrate binding protein [Gammaproteobacteria bacterium]|nr:tripartite tricarboxylate transporter substrate binding protein [Gammaproteobacteria bacterium]